MNKVIFILILKVMCVYECENVLQTPINQITQTPLSIAHVTCNFNYSQ